MKYKIRQDATGQWRWRLRAANGKIIAESGESYYNEQDCRSAIGLVKLSAGAPIEMEPSDGGIGIGR